MKRIALVLASLGGVAMIPPVRRVLGRLLVTRTGTDVGTIAGSDR